MNAQNVINFILKIEGPLQRYKILITTYSLLNKITQSVLKQSTRLIQLAAEQAIDWISITVQYNIYSVAQYLKAAIQKKFSTTPLISLVVNLGIDWALVAIQSAVDALADQIKVIIKDKHHSIHPEKIIAVDRTSSVNQRVSFIKLVNGIATDHAVTACSAISFNQHPQAKFTELLVNRTTL